MAKLTVDDLMFDMKCSEQFVMRAYKEYGLPLYRDKKGDIRIKFRSYKKWKKEHGIRKGRLVRSAIVGSLMVIVLMSAFGMIMWNGAEKSWGSEAVCKEIEYEKSPLELGTGPNYNYSSAWNGNDTGKCKD